MKCTAISPVLTFLSAVLMARAQVIQDNKAGLRSLRVSRHFAIDTSRIEHKQGPGDFLFSELGEEDKKLWIGLFQLSESMSTSPPTP
jgi:hypothetical protein